MRAYTIALALFSFGFVVGCINGLALYDVTLPGGIEDSGMTETQVEEITEGFVDGGVLSPIQSIQALYMLGGVLFSALKTALTIIPFLLAYGVHPMVALMIQGPIWLVYIVAIVQFFSGRAIKGVE